MEHAIFYSTFAFAKQQVGIFRDLVDSALKGTQQRRRQALSSRVHQLVRNLEDSQTFFKYREQKTEVGWLIIVYKTLLRRLDSS